MRLLSKAVQAAVSQRGRSHRHFWGWLNAVFNKVDYERIKSIGPDRAAAEWLLRCGAKVRFQGFDRWHHDYNGLPTGPLDRYKIQAIDATESCIMFRGFDHLDGLKHLVEMKFNKCIYIEDTCLERLSSIENLQESLNTMEVVSCGNVTDKGVIALHKLKNLESLFLSDLPGIKDKQTTADRLQTALPRLDLTLDLN
ncbi:ATP synthase subunit s, mitochondrial [Hippoglossus stenolepis]|uniref:ATP synthase subunit s, mitochondrial n=1 Tax=Hippoglossus stenolepis TaxID=195615 RepID=UPI00159C3DE6|nr:ATP synthase subunit s, mitochondrial [Hippoglossus stenolepis]XP_035024907.1 ATP synthase subunit s, mitochondrial [Hippoglossus stenolepis]